MRIFRDQNVQRTLYPLGKSLSARHLSRRWSSLRPSGSILHSLIKPEQKDRSENVFLERSGKSSQAAGAIEAVAVIRSEITRVDVRRGEQWRRTVAMKMSIAPVVVAETALTLSSGIPLGWVCIRRKNSSAYEK